MCRLRFEALVRRCPEDRLPRKVASLVGRLSDFHTVGGGYNKEDPREKFFIPKSGEGKWKPADKQTVITHRTYLTEARFIASFEGDAEIIAAAVRHLKNPVWGVWFGRKTCLPAMPLSPVCGEDSHAAACALIGRLREWEEATRRSSFLPDLDPTHLERWEEPAGDQLQPGDFHLHDQPITFGQREFHSRPIRHRHPGELP